MEVKVLVKYRKYRGRGRTGSFRFSFWREGVLDSIDFCFSVFGNLWELEFWNSLWSGFWM